jgi:hypothetical protein
MDKGWTTGDVFPPQEKYFSTHSVHSVFDLLLSSYSFGREVNNGGIIPPLLYTSSWHGM